MSASSADLWIDRLCTVSRGLVSELDLEAVLERLLAAAREITGARYAALGVLDEQRRDLGRFLASGVDQQTFDAIGEVPHGRGLLGQLIADPKPLRLTDVSEHPASYGFPPGHPPMRSFLGVPITIRGQAWGNLYLAEKDTGEFSEQDEQTAVLLAEWAGVAIDNARLYETSERRRLELEKAVRGLEAAHDVAVAIGEKIATEHVLELIVKYARALVDARSVIIMLRDGHELVLAACDGNVRQIPGARMPVGQSTAGLVLESRHAQRIADVTAGMRISPTELGVSEPRTALLVPMLYSASAVGVLAAFDRGADRAPFSEDDEQLLRTFAASAATAVALAQSVQADRLRSSLAAADAERRRWARELHDETLQGLGGLRVMLSAALRRSDLSRAQQAMREAVAHIEREIENLRAMIVDLRPAALDELGLRAAIEALLERHSQHSGFAVQGNLALRSAGQRQPRLDAELETTVYRLVQEALTNVAKHAQANNVWVAVAEADDQLLIEVRDDGRGFDPTVASPGFGLAGMRERVGLIGGELSVDSGEHGTIVRARLKRSERPSGSALQQAAR